MPSNQKNTYLYFFIGCVCSSFSAMLGGTTFVFTRALVTSLDPLVISFVRYGLTGLLFLIFFFISFKKIIFQKNDLIYMALIGIFMFTLFPVFMALGLEITTSSRAGLLYATMPIFTIIIACIFKIETFSLPKLISVILAFSGVYFCLSEFIDPTAPHPIKGDVLMTIGVISASVFTVFSGIFLKKYGNVNVLIFTLFSGSISTMLICLLVGEKISNVLFLTDINYLYLFMLIIPGGILMMYLWGKALQMISPTQASITLGFNPISATILGHFILNEIISSRIFVAIGLIIIAIFVSNWK